MSKNEILDISEHMTPVAKPPNLRPINGYIKLTHRKVCQRHLEEVLVSPIRPGARDPSCIRSRNIAFQTLVWQKTYLNLTKYLLTRTQEVNSTY